MPRIAAARFAIVAVALATTANCGGKSPAPGAPSTVPPVVAPAPVVVPSVIQGTVQLSVYQFAVISFRVDRVGSLASRVEWNNGSNDIDTAIIRGRCTVTQILEEAQGCTETATVAIDESSNRPSVLSPSVEIGDHTLIIFNFGPGADAAMYRVEGFVSGATTPSTSPPIPTSTPAPPPPPSPSTLCVPVPLSPLNNAVLDNGRDDAKDAIVWDFDWSDCARATEYFLYVTGPSAAFPLINRGGLTQSSYRHFACGSRVVEQNRSPWSWRVRAKTDGVWGNWSPFRTFSVEPVNTDPALPCQ